jgi:hypothetical protein
MDDVVELKGKYYNIPSSKIGPKPVQKPHIPIYMGGFSPNAFSRIVNYDINGWLGPIGGPLEYLDIANKANKDPNRFKVILFTYPDIDSDSKNQSTTTTNQDKRLPLTGTIDQPDSDIERINHMGIDHIMFGHTGRNLDKMLDVTKQLAKFAR